MKLNSSLSFSKYLCLDTPQKSKWLWLELKSEYSIVFGIICMYGSGIAATNGMFSLINRLH